MYNKSLSNLFLLWICKRLEKTFYSVTWQLTSPEFYNNFNNQGRTFQGSFKISWLHRETIKKMGKINKRKSIFSWQLIPPLSKQTCFCTVRKNDKKMLMKMSFSSVGINYKILLLHWNWMQSISYINSLTLSLFQLIMSEKNQQKTGWNEIKWNFDIVEYKMKVIRFSNAWKCLIWCLKEWNDAVWKKLECLEEHGEKCLLWNKVKCTEKNICCELSQELHA